MSRTAKVRSTDALLHLAAALQSLGEEVAVSLDDLGMQIQRATQWIQYERKDYWVHEYRRAQEAVAEARINLERRKLYRVGDQTPACREEKMALEAAKRRVEVAREKIEAVKRWGRLLEHEAMDCRTATAPLSHWAQADVPRALALLRRMSAALDSYVDLRGPAVAGAEVGATAEPLAAPPAESPSQGSPAAPTEDAAKSDHAVPSAQEPGSLREDASADRQGAAPQET